VHVRRFVAQGHVLPHVGVVVSHGGSGSVLGALAYGRPMVILAMGADQPRNAERCVALGVGRSLDPVSATPADIAAAIDAVLGDRAAGVAADSLARTMAELPTPATAVTWLEALAARRPLP
jgi:UDP:flavonoid glycosyltransferase YjiC (YdhE family)